MKCDICEKEPKHTFFDGKTKMGPWAVMCKPCWEKVGCGTGTGRGQEYDVDTKEKLRG